MAAALESECPKAREEAADISFSREGVGEVREVREVRKMKEVKEAKEEAHCQRNKLPLLIACFNFKCIDSS